MDRERSAKHEAAHVVAASALGWETHWARVFPAGGGEACVVSPEGLDRNTHAREFAVISYAAREHVGWTASHADRGDLRDAHKALAGLTDDHWRVSALKDELRRQARQLVAMAEFRAAAHPVAQALIMFGELNAHDLEGLLRRHRFRFEPRRELDHAYLPR